MALLGDKHERYCDIAGRFDSRHEVQKLKLFLALWTPHSAETYGRWAYACRSGGQNYVIGEAYATSSALVGRGEVTVQPAMRAGSRNTAMC